MAWLQAVPEGEKETRFAKFKKQKEAGTKPQVAELPTMGAASYLIDWLFEIGAGSDGRPVTWGEINAWKQATDTKATPGELLALRSLSVDYMSELQAARDPYRVHPGADRSLENANKLKAAFRKMTA